MCHVLGYGVPEDVSVIGVDDDQYACELQNPPLSSVRMASQQAGDEAAALLDRLMHGDERMSGQRIMTHATGVSARQSTNVRVVRHANVRKALRSIRENAGCPSGSRKLSKRPTFPIGPWTLPFVRNWAAQSSNS